MRVFRYVSLSLVVLLYPYAGYAQPAFTDVTDGDLLTAVRSWGASWVDVDGDLDLDLFVSRQATSGGNVLYLNQGGTFTLTDAGDLTAAQTPGSLGHTWADYDNDGDLDLYVTNYAGTPTNDFYRNDAGTYVAVTEGPLAEDTGGFGLANTWGDLDNDGDLDVLLTTGGGAVDRLYRNDGDGSFTRIASEPLTTRAASTSGATLGDYDNDGDLDLAVTTQVNGGGPVRLYRNDAPSGNSWLKLNLVGTTSNRAAIVAKVRATATIGGATVTQFREVSAQNTFNGQNALAVHFGLGDAAAVDVLEITWPSGTVETFADVPANAFFEVTEDAEIVPVANEPGDPASPATFSLAAAYPNPFATMTTLPYTLAALGTVRLVVYDLLGRRVRTLVDAERPAGSHAATWDGTDAQGRKLGAGFYLYRIEAAGQAESRRIVLVR